MDIYAQALSNYYYKRSKSKLWIKTSYGTKEEMPVEAFFRNESEMPELELFALDMCRGKILDIGAGAGSHSLYLQTKGFDVTALEISAGACEIMRERGVRKIINRNIFDYNDQKFDTLILLMNGIGLCETIDGLSDFLNHGKSLLNPGGQILLDSSDITYLYDDVPFPDDKYFGEISYQYFYQGNSGNWFKWLYADKSTLEKITSESGWNFELLFEDAFDQFLTKLTLC